MSIHSAVPRESGAFRRVVLPYRVTKDQAKRSVEQHRQPPVPGTQIDSQLANEELALAALIHAKLMAIPLLSSPFAFVEGATVPCRAIGGDYFDAVVTSDSISLVVADVSGKGVPAAIVAAMVQGIIHAQMVAREPLARIAASVNQFLCSRATGKYATMVMLKVGLNGEGEYLNCGHVQPLLVSGSRIQRLEAGNVVVGLLPHAEFNGQSLEIHKGDRILIFTDGIMEAEDPSGATFGDEHFDFLTGQPCVEDILRRVSRFVKFTPQQDDWTLVQLRFDGAEPNCHC